MRDCRDRGFGLERWGWDGACGIRMESAGPWLRNGLRREMVWGGARAERRVGLESSVRCRLRTGSKPLADGRAWTEELLKTMCLGMSLDQGWTRLG